ncbi:hypothetical protein ACVWZZ_001762 [Bradyrhizobium sp. LM6.10]
MTRIGIRRTARQGIDQVPREYRHEQVGGGRAQQAANDDKRTPRLLQPVPEHEGQHDAYRCGLF